MSSKTPTKRITVPNGFILLHEKWRGSSLIDDINRQCRKYCFEDLGIIDFMVSDENPIVVLTETDMLTPEVFKTKINKFRKHYQGRGVLISCRNSAMMEEFSEIQKLAVIQHSLTLIPINSLSDLPELLLNMIKLENKSPHNPFKFKKIKEEPYDDRDKQVALLSIIPGVREVKALRLLKTFGTITAISNASFEKLSEVVGSAVAKSITDFLHSDGKNRNK